MPMYTNAILDLSRRIRQNVGVENQPQTVQPAPIGEEILSINPSPGECKHTEDTPYIQHLHTINYRQNCQFSGWKNWSKTGSNCIYRTIENSVILGKIKATENQPNNITILLYGIIYIVVQVSPKSTELQNYHSGKKAITSSYQRVQQIEVKNIPAIQPTLF